MSIYLDTIRPVQSIVGYGAVGWRGDLGYEGKSVRVGRTMFHHAISTHPPARLLFPLQGHYNSFCCRVALNDDVPSGRAHADFFVLADGIEVASAAFVESGTSPREISAPITGAQILQLCVRTSRWEYAHAVWLDPVLEAAPAAPVASLEDCLGRAEILPLPTLPCAERCVATVISPGFAGMADDMLGSLLAHGGCQDALLVLFAINPDEQCRRVAMKYGAVLAPCRARAALNPMSKALLYSAARVIDAKRFVFLDADTLVVGSIEPIFYALDACSENTVLACREGNGHGLTSLRHALETVYGGTPRDLEILGISAEEAAYPLVVNDGVFAAGRSALLALDGVIRAIPHARAWTDGNMRVWWRNQFVFNLAIARLRCGVELDSVYNLQLHAHNIQPVDESVYIDAEWQGRKTRVLHFSGGAKQNYHAVRNLYSRVDTPVPNSGPGDTYSVFLRVLRAWLGRRGLPALAWSLYGTSDARSAHVSDSSMFPLLAALHYLVRANGCARVLETGTARGVSAACLASAVAYRGDAAVVSFDPFPCDGRRELWTALPESFRRLIDARPCGSIEGMEAALAAGETYHAALLDSVHTEEQVWAEFNLARRLVCASGLILIHDARFVNGTVPAALDRIQRAGYPVVRLWCAAAGVPEDDQLGLAVVENRTPPNNL